MVCTSVFHVITRITTHLPTPKGWKAEWVSWAGWLTHSGHFNQEFRSHHKPVVTVSVGVIKSVVKLESRRSGSGDRSSPVGSSHKPPMVDLGGKVPALPSGKQQLSVKKRFWHNNVTPYARLRLRNDLYCVGWDVKLYSLTHPICRLLHHSLNLRSKIELCAAAADILLTPPPPIITDRRAAAADRMSASRRRRFREVFTSRCTTAICC